MIVIGMIAIVMAFGIPSIVEQAKKGPLRQTTSDFLEACHDARAQAILRGQVAVLVIDSQSSGMRVEMVSDAGSAGTEEQQAAREGKHGKLFSAHWSDDVAIEMVDVNYQNMMEMEQARVRFFPNGTCDEFSIVLRSLQNEYRQVWLDVTTAFATLESDPLKFHGLKP
ncbi:MAG: hypothetical protein HZA89_14360 [Verrucomicrobia bacterium]|nr:hypothetical protein [Verrucomicrobiota bacterium]